MEPRAIKGPRLGCPALAKSPSPAPPPPLPDCNFLRLLANSPAAFQAYCSSQTALAGGQLTPAERELLALAVAEINGSPYDLSAHYATGRQIGLGENEIRLARKAAAVDPRQNAMLRFTRAVALQHGEISDAEFQGLRQAGFTDAHVAEIIAHIALNAFANYFNNFARTEVDFPFLKPGADAPVEPGH